MQTASLVNTLMAASNAPAPVVGMGATELCWTDRHAYTVVSVNKAGNRVTVQRDLATCTDKLGMSGAQSYTYTPDPNGRQVLLSLRKDGKWRTVGSTQQFALGYRDEHYDFSF